MNEQANGDPLHGQFVDIIAGSIKERLGAEAPGAKTQPTSKNPVPESPVPESPVPEKPNPAPEQPDNRPVVSTAKVTDFSDVFKLKEAEAPKTGEKVQLPLDTDVPDPEDLQTDKARNAWQELKSREKALRAAAVELQRRLDEAVKQGSLVASERAQFAEELKTRDDRIKSLEDELGKLSLEHRPEFRDKYDKPMTDLLGQVVGVLTDSVNAEADKINDIARDLMDASDADFNKMVGQLPASVQGSLLDKRRAYNTLADARDHAVAEWRTTQAGVEEVSSQQQIAQRAERRRDMAEYAIRFAKEITPPEKRLPIFAENTYSEDIAAADQAFRGFMQEADEGQLANAAYRGMLTPVLVRQIALLAEAVDQWRSAYEQSRGLRHPSVSAIRIRSEEPAPSVPKEVSPLVPGKNFHGTVENTIAETLRGFSPRR